MLSHSWAIGVRGAMVNKLPACQVGGRRLEPHSGIHVSKRQFFSSLLIRKSYLILWGASVTIGMR